MSDSQYRFEEILAMTPEEIDAELERLHYPRSVGRSGLMVLVYRDAEIDPNDYEGTGR